MSRGPSPTELSPDGWRKLRRAQRRLASAREAFDGIVAELAENESAAAVARALGITRQTLHERLRSSERDAGNAS